MTQKGYFVHYAFKTAVFATALLLSGSALAQSNLPDTPENRLLAAGRIVQDGSFIKMVIENEIRKLPLDRQDAMRKVFEKPGMSEAMQVSLVASFANNFSPRELAILAPLYGTEEGVEALRKFDKFHRDLAANMLEQLKRLSTK